MKQLIGVMFLALSFSPHIRAADKVQGLEDFLASPARLKDIRAFCLILASQTDPPVGARNAAELQKNYWAARPDAKLTAAERELEMTRFESDFKHVAEVIRTRDMTEVYFCGVDSVTPVKKAQYWYFCGFTPRGPVLIRLAIQYEPGPPTLFGVSVWTDWDEIHSISKSIELPAGDRAFSCTYEKKPPPAPTTRQADS